MTDTGRTVAVTGAASGIGLAIAKAFISQDDHVYLSDVARGRLDEAVRACGARAVGVLADVADYDAMATLVDRAKERSGRLDVLVNCAGVVDGCASVAETTPDMWRRIIDINLTGCFFGAKAAAETMIEQRSGRIINIGSISSFIGGANGVAYTSAKAGVLGLTRRLAFDLGPHGITANAICPGVIATDIGANSAEVLADETLATGPGPAPRELQDYLIRVGRPGTVDDVAGVAVFLASGGAAYINGATIAVDGGWLAT